MTLNHISSPLGLTDISHVQTVLIRGEGTSAAVCCYIHAVHIPNHCVLRVKVAAVWSATHVVRTLCWRPVTEKYNGIQHQQINNKLLKIL